MAGGYVGGQQQQQQCINFSEFVTEFWEKAKAGYITDIEVIAFMYILQQIKPGSGLINLTCEQLKLSLSSKCCFGMTILAHGLGHEQLLKLCNEYVSKNFDVIATDVVLSSLNTTEFEMYLDASTLSTKEIGVLVITYWTKFLKRVIHNNVKNVKSTDLDNFLAVWKRPGGVTVDLHSTLLSPKNCIFNAVLVGRIGNHDLIKCMEEYIDENMDLVTIDKTFPSLSNTELEQSLRLCSLSKKMKTKLLVKWVDVSPDERMKDVKDMFLNAVYHDKGNSMVRNAAISLQLASVYPQLEEVTMFCSKFLENSLSVTNCFEIAVAANKSGVEHLKNAADLYVVRNFCAVASHIGRTVVKEDLMMLSCYLKITHIPKLLHHSLKLKLLVLISKGPVTTTEEKLQLLASANAYQSAIVTSSKDKTLVVQLDHSLSEDGIREWELSLIKEKKSAKHAGQSTLEEDTHIQSQMKLPAITTNATDGGTTEFSDYKLKSIENDLSGERNDTGLGGNIPEDSQTTQPTLSIDGEVLDDEEQPHREIMRMFFERRKKKAFKTESIGPEGGVLELFGCCLKFPTKALKKEKEITISVDNNPENYPKGSYVIAPVFGIEPSMSFAKPIIVRICTWFRGVDGETTMATLFSRKKGFDWKKVKEVPLRSTNEIEFLVLHFSDTGVGVSESDSSNGIHTLKNSVYIQRDTGVIQSNFYRSEKDEHDVNTVMWEKSCATFTSQCITVKGKHDDVVKVKVKLTCPEEKDVPGKSWRHSDCFTIKEAFESGMHTIQAKLYRPPKNYEDLVEGDYEVFVGQETVASAFLVRKWPVMLDPLVQRTAVNQTISGVNVSGSGPITNTMSNSKVNPKANA